MSKVYNNNTVDEKTSNEYSDDELVDFNFGSTATNFSNLSSINKNNSNAYDITDANEEKTVEAVLVDSVPINEPDNLHLAETINSTTDQFKALIEKARKFTEDNDRAHSSSKKSEDIVEETHAWKRVCKIKCLECLECPSAQVSGCSSALVSFEYTSVQVPECSSVQVP